MKKLLLSLLLACSTCLGAYPALAIEAGPNFEAVICDPFGQGPGDGAFSFFAFDPTCGTESLFFGKTSGANDFCLVGGSLFPPGTSRQTFKSLSFDIEPSDLGNPEPFVYLEFLSFPQKRREAFITPAAFFNTGPGACVDTPFHVSILASDVNTNFGNFISNGFIKPTPGAYLEKMAIWSDEVTVDFSANEVNNVLFNGGERPTIIFGGPFTDCDLGEDLL